LRFCGNGRGLNPFPERLDIVSGSKSDVPKKIMAAAAALVVFLPCLGVASVIGTRLENFQLPDSSGKRHSLFDHRGSVVVLTFWSFKCPVSLAYEQRLRDLQQQYRSKGVVILGIDSNSDESAEAIQKNAASLDIGYPILLDPDGILADRLGATHTPSIFILDRNFVIRYEGMIDNGRKPGDRNREAYAEQALDAILAGKPVPVEVTRGGGCSIKRRR